MPALKNFLVPVSLNGNEIRFVAFQVLAAAPSNPVVGQFYYDSGLERLLWWNGAAWINPTARANHSGTQVAATISDFDTQVRTSKLNQMAQPDGAVNMNGQRISNVPTPTQGTDAVNKDYADSVASGLDVKPSVRAATTVGLNATRAGNVLTADANGAISIDGIALQVGESVLVKDQGTAQDNGIYVVTSTGGAGAPFVLTRRTDADTSAEVTSGLFVFVTEGTANDNTGWILTTNDAIVLNTTPLVFTQFSGAGTVIGGAGLTRTGNQLDVGQGNGIIVNADSIQVDTGVVVRKYIETIGDGSAASIAVVHGLGTRDAQVKLRANGAPYDYYECGEEATDANTITLKFASPPAVNAYRAIVFV